MTHKTARKNKLATMTREETAGYNAGLKAAAEWKKMPIDLQRGYRAGAKDALEIVHLYISPSPEAKKIIRKIKELTK